MMNLYQLQFIIQIVGVEEDNLHFTKQQNNSLYIYNFTILSQQDEKYLSFFASNDKNKNPLLLDV